MKLRGSARLAGFGALTAAYGARLVAGRAEARRQARVTHAWASTLCRLLGMRVERAGPLPTAGSLLVSNHRSYADIAALASCLPMTFLAKAEVLKWPVLGPAAARAGTVFVSRGDRGSGAAALERMRALVEAGVSILVFPEGTTVGPPGIGRFKRGAFQLAADAGIPVVPIALEYERETDAWTTEGDDSFTPHFIETFGRRSVGVHVEFGGPVDAPDADALLDAAHRWISSHLTRPQSD